MKKIERMPACAPTPGVYFDIPELCTVKRTDLDRLEAENQEMLEYFIDMYDDWKYVDYKADSVKNLIEKVSGKTWEEIKAGNK